ncbi:FAD-dependent oxidoreductase [Caldivirga maquilingensis]|uniref:FAD dependent oxidoreductase n=1 Tax=Caldivirga maquilingensis (strain ATCC 700844 / DSM 13496 / JCM 10307 / IC-167) TaxID=397948 RepID=A8MAZ1_CALMQ|nr:FAD-dependent oxidoreductase [Caldivirga maquilingensis]ABW02620.1 FAD dependent oxidoreductase [Caldivirga maquilingensis IC-167]
MANPNPDVVVIGGGVNGLFAALDLSLRGFQVVLLERNVIGSGASGRMHGLLHSGARYVATDPKAAVECAEENRIIASIAPHAVENTGGYYVAVDKDDEEYREQFIKGLRAVNIDYREVDPRDALREEPNLNPEVKAVVEVPDKVVFAKDLLFSVAASAYREGALIIQGAEVVGFNISGSMIDEVVVKDHVTGDIRRIRPRVIAVTAGPWTYKVVKMANIEVDMMPTMGVMVVYRRRLTGRVINRMRMPSDGDILLPYASSSIVGTTAVIVDDPDNLTISSDDIDFLTSEGSRMVPMLTKVDVVRAYASVRPLIKMPGVNAREAARDFAIIKHEKPSNLISVIGGKFTTGRLVGERLSDEVSGLLGSSKGSMTRNHPLFGANLYEDLRELDNPLRSLALDFKGSIDEERGRVAALTLLVSEVTRSSRRLMGWS